MADVTGFPISADMAGALVRLEPGGMRQLHWHVNLDEWQYVINGTIQVSTLQLCPATEPVSSRRLCPISRCLGFEASLGTLPAAHLLPPSACTAVAEQDLSRGAKHGVRMQAGVFNATGHYEESILRAGDAGFAPVSSGHYFKNIGETESYVVLIFNAGRFTNVDLTALVGNVPAEVGHCRRRTQCRTPPCPQLCRQAAPVCSRLGTCMATW